MSELSVEVRSSDGAATGSLDLDAGYFGIRPHLAVLHQVVTAQLAAARSGTHSTKTRAEVSGGGRKPFKQKGTGRARQGSERAPHFTGGGVAFGPKPRSYRQRTPRKMIQLALRSALSDRASEGRVMVVDRWPWETPSTKAARTSLEALGLAGTGSVLIVLSRSDEEASKSFRNLPGVQLLLAGELNAYDVMRSEWVVFTTATLPGSAGHPPAQPSPDYGAGAPDYGAGAQDLEASAPVGEAGERGPEPPAPAAGSGAPDSRPTTDAEDHDDE